MSAETSLHPDEERRAPFRRPADYYSAPTPDPVFPPWASYGCGAASLLVLLVVFAGGAFLSRGGFTKFMDLAFGMTMGELRGMYASDVTDAEKQALEAEIERVRENLRNERVPVTAVDPLLRTIRRVSSDEKLEPAEVERIVDAAREVNATAKRP